MRSKLMTVGRSGLIIPKANLLAVQKRMGLNKVELSVTIKSINKDKQIVTGEVYAPNIIDSHGEMMEEEDVEYMAHSFVSKGVDVHYDIMHDNKPIDAVPVESWIARGHPDWNEGSWVLSTKIKDRKVWDQAKVGKLGGYSIEALVRKVSAVAEFEVSPNIFGYTETHEDHDHAFFAMVDDFGVVIGGYTSVDKGHRHVIKFGTRTEVSKDHSHRFFLP